MGRVVIACYLPKAGKESALHDLAHENRAVRAMWEDFDALCTYVPFAEVPESTRLFFELTPLP